MSLAFQSYGPKLPLFKCIVLNLKSFTVLIVASIPALSKSGSEEDMVLLKMRMLKEDIG
jgi:hypothetical protein